MRPAYGRGLNRDLRARRETNGIRWKTFSSSTIAFRPAKLLRWHPGIGVALQGADRQPIPCHKHYHETREGVTAGVSGFRRKESSRSNGSVKCCVATRERPGCLRLFWTPRMGDGLPRGNVRHAQWPLRIRHKEIADLVESLGPRCTHYDAFRFFTPAARPLNRYQPTRATAAALEQPGCLHANMDLYKWAFKLSPFTASELLADCFELARDIRALDMRASPYDFTPWDISRSESRAQMDAPNMRQLQREFAICAAPLREASDQSMRTNHREFPGAPMAVREER